MAGNVTGVDIGSRSAVLVSGRAKGNTFVLSDFWAGSHAASTVAEGWAHVPASLRTAPMCVGVGGRDVSMRYSQVPRLADWQLRKLMRFEVDEIGGQAGASMASDFNVLPELPEIEGEDVVLLALARESLLAEHADGIAHAKGKLRHFTPSVVGLYNAWLGYGVIQDDVVLVANIGHDHIDVVIARGTDLVFARTLAGGSRLFDEALAERFDVSLERAETLKAELASLAPDAARAGGNREKAHRAIAGAAGQLLSLIQSALLFCKTQLKLSGLGLDRVAICGGGAALDGLDGYLASNLGVPVDVFDPFGVVDASRLSPEAAQLLDEYRLESVVALGLASGASDPHAYSIEILPESVRKRREFWGGTALSIAAAVLCVVYLGVRVARESAMLDETRAEVARLTSTLSRARRADLETRELLDDSAEVSARALELWLAAGSGEQASRALEVLWRELPPDFWITELSSRYAVSGDLGLERGDERPVLHVEGRVREGTRAAASEFAAFLAALQEELELPSSPGARLVPALSPAGDVFTLDLCLVGPAPSGDDAATSEGES